MRAQLAEAVVLEHSDHGDHQPRFEREYGKRVGDAHAVFTNAAYGFGLVGRLKVNRGCMSYRVG